MQSRQTRSATGTLTIIFTTHAYFVPGGRPPQPPPQPPAQLKAVKKPRKKSTKKKPKGYLSAITAAYIDQESQHKSDNDLQDEDEPVMGYSQPRNGDLTDTSHSDDETESGSTDYHGMLCSCLEVLHAYLLS